MTLTLAKNYADKLVEWLSPHCDKIEIAGSIRRSLPQCGDVDLVVIPKRQQDTDLLGVEVDQSNLLFDFLQDYVRDRNPVNSPGRKPHFISGGERPGKQLLIDLPKCQLDLWFATPKNWATILLCRTGSRDHNRWLCERAQDRGLKWSPYEGIFDLGPHCLGTPKLIEHSTEEAIYNALGLAMIPPHHRELPWLIKNIDSGL